MSSAKASATWSGGTKKGNPKEHGEPFSYFRGFDSILHAEAYFLDMSPPGLTQLKPAAFYSSISQKLQAYLNTYCT